jgi:NAD(P)-dependent dehydrogenase (short-subunit alcohol dehydrogenase family)
VKPEERDVYAPLTPAEVAALPTVFRDDLFRDRVVLVSGGAGGIGFATSVLFGRLGASIVSCGRDEAKMAWLEEQLGALDIPCLTRAMTIRDADQVADLMAAVWDRFGRLDVLINNAGGQFAAPALEISPKGWNAVVETNLTGSWYMMQAAARQWREHGQPGSIINMVTVQGTCHAGIAHTVAARAGEIELSKALAVEWAPYEIRVNCVAIGIVASPGLANYPETAQPSFDHNPMRRLGGVQDIAQACVYLAAPSGDFVNATVLAVDGGAGAWGEYWPLGRPDYFQVDY